MNITLNTILPDEVWEGFSFGNYSQSESEILNPAIVKAGYTLVGNWYTSEGDSFGPLIRACRALTPEGHDVVVWYRLSGTYG